MKSKKHFIIFLVAIGALQLSMAQQAVPYSLEDAIHQSQSQSPGFKLAQTQKEVSYYQYRIYKSDFNPQIVFFGNAPVFNNEYYAVRQPDGTIKFQSIKQNNASIGFSLDQPILLTGGVLSLKTDLTRFDDFKAKTKQYNGTPVYLRLSQPISAFNELKWRKKIEPLKYEESKKEFIQRTENMAQQTVALYFDVLDALSDIQIASGNLRNAGTNYEIEEKRVNLGTTSEDKLLQLQLQVLNNSQTLSKAKYDYQVAQLNLKSFVGSKDDAELEFSIPANIPQLHIEINEAIAQARKNRAEFTAFRRKMSEAARDVAAAKAARQEVNLVASYGLNNVGDEIRSIYESPNNQQRFSVGFNIPIVDWGRRSARYQTAKAIEKLTVFNNEIDEINILQEVTILVKNFELLASNILLAQKKDSVAQRRYTLANNLFQVGKLTITDIGLAQSARDEARKSYLNALRAYWDAYYTLRRLTLYDFEKSVPLYRD